MDKGDFLDMAQGEKEVASAGSFSQAREGVFSDISELSKSVSSATDAVSSLVSGEGTMLDAAMSVRAAVEGVQELSLQVSESMLLPLMTHLLAFKGQATLPAAKQLDPVMGIDVHFVNIPPGVPTPLPHPYIATLFRAKDWVSCMVHTFKPQIIESGNEIAKKTTDQQTQSDISKHSDTIFSTVMGLAGLGATVKFGGFLPRAVTGTLNKSLPHIPFGAGWSPGFAVPIKKNHGKMFLGSLFVSADGDPMAGMGHLNYDCWDIGVPDLFKSQRNAAKKSPDPSGAQAELFVPSGTVLPIPWGRPVLVNSVPTPINPLSIGDRLFKAGLGKLKKLRAMGEFRKKTQNNPTIPCSKRVPLSDSDFSAFYERQKKEKAKKKKGKQWKEHENKVSKDLKTKNPSSTVGKQVTLVVEGIDTKGKTFKKRIRIDNLQETSPGTYQLTDAKHSEVKDLTQVSNKQLRNTFTTNQKTVYDAIGGTNGAKITKVTPVGENASKAGLVPNEPINIEPKVNIGVNNSNGSITYRKYP